MHYKADLTLMLSSEGQSKIIIRTSELDLHIPNATYQVQWSSAFWFWIRIFLTGYVLYKDLAAFSVT